MNLSTTKQNLPQFEQGEFFANKGICKKVFTNIRHPKKGDPYRNAILDIGNGKEKVFLICLAKDSDFTPKNSLLLEGQEVILQRKETNELFIKYFNGLPSKTKTHILNNSAEEKEEADPVIRNDKDTYGDPDSLLDKLSKKDLVMIIQSLRTLLFIPFNN